jgi:hypothetical protein
VRLYVEPVVFLGRKRQKRFSKGTLNRSQRLLAGLFLLGTLLRLDQPAEVRLQRVQRSHESRITLVVPNATQRFLKTLQVDATAVFFLCSFSALADNQAASQKVSRPNLGLAQLAFWLLAATDGHAKNFSLHQHAGGAYSLTPLYDVLSAWPIIGHGKNQLPFEKAKFATALPGKRVHYRLREITARHWRELADHVGVTDLWPRMQAFVESTAAALERVDRRLPQGFPERIFAAIQKGVRDQVDRFTQVPQAK